MNDQTAFRRIAAITAILSAPVTLAATIVLSMAVDFNPDILSSPADLITLGAQAAEIFRWGEILELGAPMLLLIPAALYLWDWLKPHSPRMVTLYTVFGLASILFGTIATLLRASFFPAMMSAYSQAAEPQRELLLVLFQAVTDFAFEGLLALEYGFLGLWWLGIGLVLRGERRGLGVVTAVLGITILAAGAGWLLRVEPLARLEMAFFLVPVWVVWLGIVIWRRGENSEQSPAPAT